MSTSDNPVIREHVALSPDGKILILPKWLFDSLYAVHENKYSGEVIVNCSQGGFTGGMLKQVLKNGNGNHV